MYYRVYSDSINGCVLTKKAYDQVKINMIHDVKEISSVEIDNERIYDIEDLSDLGYNIPRVEDEVLTEQTDDMFLDNIQDAYIDEDEF